MTRPVLVKMLRLLLPAMLIGSWLLPMCAQAASDPQIDNVLIWIHTPAWKLAGAVKMQDTAKIVTITKTNPELLNYQEPKYGVTLLIWAVGVEKYRSAEALLKCGANPNIATTCGGETALFVAASYSWVDFWAKEDPRYVKLLLKYGADPNITYRGGDPENNIVEPGASPLMESIGCGMQKTRALVEGGADIDYQTASGKTAAVVALDAGSINVTEDQMEYAYFIIVEKKAKVTAPYFLGRLFPASTKDTEKKYYPVDILRDWIPKLASKGHAMKMKIVEEFARQGVDYWKTPIPERRLEQIKKIYPDTWQEYIKQY